MAPPARSRKGKKEWRKNIDDSEVVALVAKETHEQRHGPAVESLPDDQLFFVDKSKDEKAGATALAARALKKKREPRLTRAQLILSAPQAVKPVVQYKAPKRKDGGLPKPRQQQLEEARQKAANGHAIVTSSKKRGADADAEVAPASIWDGPGDDEVYEAEASSMLPSTSSIGGTKAKRARVAKIIAPPRPKIKAVEVDAAGCSYNPHVEAHQEALAAVVADELKKELKKALGPAPVPLLVDAEGGDALDELARLQTEAAADDNEIELESEEGSEGDGGDVEAKEGAAAARARHEAAKKTKKDRLREARRKSAEKEEASKRALKSQRRQLDALDALQGEVEEEEQEQAARRTRRKVVQEEKEAAQPPRLGKLRYEPLPLQVLTTDEVGGGLRKLKAYPMLAQERFKSLQKRGLVEPRRPAAPRGPGRVVVYEKNARREKVEEGQAELVALRKQNALARKAAGIVA